MEAAKRDSRPTRSAGFEFANSVFERALEFSQHGTMPFGVSIVVNESKRCAENCSQITSASRCHGGGASFGRGERDCKSVCAP